MRSSTRMTAEALAGDLRERFAETKLTMLIGLPIPADRTGRGVADIAHPVSPGHLRGEEAGLILLADDPEVLEAAAAAVEEIDAEILRRETLAPGVTPEDLRVAVIATRPA